MIEALEGFLSNVVAFARHVTVTGNDYETVLAPKIAKALEQNEKVHLYYGTAADCDGIDAGSVLEDTMAGVNHASPCKSSLS